MTTITTITEVYQSTDSKEAVILRVDRNQARIIEIALEEFAESAATDAPCFSEDVMRIAGALRRANS